MPILMTHITFEHPVHSSGREAIDKGGCYIISFGFNDSSQCHSMNESSDGFVRYERARRFSFQVGGCHFQTFGPRALDHSLKYTGQEHTERKQNTRFAPSSTVVGQKRGSSTKSGTTYSAVKTHERDSNRPRRQRLKLAVTACGGERANWFLMGGRPWSTKNARN